MRAVLSFLAIVAVVVTGSAFAVRADERTNAAGSGANPAAPASGGSQKTATPPIEFAKNLRAIFVIALSPDPATNAKIAVALASELRSNPNRSVQKAATAPAGAFSLRNLATAVVPQGGWGLNDYIEQCQTYPDTTQGAFIVLPPSTGSDSENYLVVVRDNVTLSLNAMIAGCERDGATPAKGTPKILWVSDTATGRYGRSAIQFLPFAVLTSVYLAFAPQRTYQTTSTTVYPTPNPLPATGAHSSTQTVNATVLNASGTGSLQTNVVNAVAGAQLAFGRHGATDHLTMHAAEDAVGHLLLMLSDECPRLPRRQAPAEAPAAAPTAAPFCDW